MFEYYPYFNDNISEFQNIFKRERDEMKEVCRDILEMQKWHTCERTSDEDRERRKNIHCDYIFTYILNQYFFLIFKIIWDLHESPGGVGRGSETHAQPLIATRDRFWL